MNKIIIASFLLIYSLILLLATVSLEPYLAPDQANLPKKKISLPRASHTKDPLVKIETIKKGETHSIPTSTNEEAFSQTSTDDSTDLFENKTPTTAPDNNSAAKEKAAVYSLATENYPAEGKTTRQRLSALIELNVITLPKGDYPYSILLATYMEQEPAQRALQSYQKRGITAHWVKVNLGDKGVRYRLFAGVFSTRDDAKSYLEQHRLAEKLVRPTYYAARIGIYQNKLQLITDFIKAGDANVIPYVLNTNNGDYYLYVGAFYTLIDAANKCRVLHEAGLECKPVKRSTISSQYKP